MVKVIEDGVAKRGDAIPMTLPVQLTLLMLFFALMMGMFMPNLLVLIMNKFLGLFWFLRPLLLCEKTHSSMGT